MIVQLDDNLLIDDKFIEGATIVESDNLGDASVVLHLAEKIPFTFDVNRQYVLRGRFAKKYLDDNGIPNSIHEEEYYNQLVELGLIGDRTRAEMLYGKKIVSLIMGEYDNLP